MFLLSTPTLLSVAGLLFAGAAQVQAHIAPWAKGMWDCDPENNVRF